jgi:hypothetical protein
MGENQQKITAAHLPFLFEIFTYDSVFSLEFVKTNPAL